ncbi:Deoxyguanosinetriphosphate triphosphohydrolase-like protein [Candidatus Bilamarchaeum dharawalense]|uniref:Deoxyguanosinetriphosphate triphosphohydrolase-like protein n=1 Tax=Candidatus Bilamarchaeum dharawalense TaxID=2885759 RepID=A0A5E4LRQ7_9ARCH|nr:Deoxyguanosinetriphosphate triphosphohydrolase-like protein [Candidatus Bilamarchaeum dharawalense]
MIIKDEIHGTVEFNELEEKIIDSAHFQRLRRIKQMSVTNLVYPGANHSRFEHSIGTAHLSEIIARSVDLEEDEIQKVKLYGLLHDIGHVAFSHEGEDVLKKYIGNHEEVGRQKILEGEIADILSENYQPREIADIGGSPNGNIVESDLGADRMDYLKRDALNTGVAYGIIDIDRIVHTIKMEKGKMYIEKGGLEAAENLLVARFMMFSAVYLHRTVRIATAMLYRAIEGAISDDTIAPERFTELDDESAMAEIAKSETGGKYANALLRRHLYKEVCSFPKNNWTETKAKKLEKQVSEKINQDIIIDFPHPFFKSVEFQVKTDDGLCPIVEVSQLVQSLKKTEEDRMRVLVLAEEDVRTRFGDKIRKLIQL